MKKTMVLLLFALAGCAQLDKIIQPRRPSPEERAQQMYIAYLGLLLMQQGQPIAAPPPQIYVINGRQIVCTQMNNVVTCN